MPMPDSIILASAHSWSGALRRKLTGDPAFGHWLSEAARHPVSRQTIHLWHDELRTALDPDGTHYPETAESSPQTHVVRQILRQLRTRVFHTLMVRDINGTASLLEVVTAMSTLADLAIAQAYRTVMAELAAVHGIPRDPRN